MSNDKNSDEYTYFNEPDFGKKDNFFGDRSVVLSQKQQEVVKKNPISKNLYITDIGFYPNAKNHYVKRDEPVDEHILIYCIDGTGTIKLSEEVYKLKANDFFVIPSGTKHKYWSSRNTPWSIYWLHFGGKQSKNFEQFYGHIIPIDPSSQARIKDRLSVFNEILTALENGFSIENINYANMCLNGLLASFFFIQAFRMVKGFQSSNPVDTSILYMQNKINSFLTVKELAENVQLSESHFSKVFRNKTGSSPLEYFINLKMQEAVRLLTNQSLKIKEVAFNLGYSDQYYFTRIFTKHMGVSPKSFIKTSNRE